MSIIPDTERHLVPWPLRVVLWISVVALVAVVAKAAEATGPFFLWVEKVTEAASRVPVIGDVLVYVQPGPTYLSAAGGLVIGWLLSRIYARFRRVGAKRRP